MATLARKPHTVVSSRLINAVLGLERKIQTAAMKHGIATESRAASHYTAIAAATHVKFRTSKTGLVVSSTYPYLAASPDLCIECKCHGRGLCEIKCPFKNRHLSPSDKTCKYLVNESGTCMLSRKHAYYFQMQAQMGVTGVRYCDFFVYTMSGYHLERIEYDPELWESMLERCTAFWKKYILPRLQKNVVMPQDQLDELSTDAETDSIGCDISEENSTLQTDHDYNMKQEKRLRQCPIVSSLYPAVCLCPKCYKTCNYSERHFTSDSIQCSSCQLWHHHVCVGFSYDDDTWMCDSCLLEF
jgi:hypothetical protein